MLIDINRVAIGVPGLTGCGKINSAQKNFDGLHVCLRRAQSSGASPASLVIWSIWFVLFLWFS